MLAQRSFLDTRLGPQPVDDSGMTAAGWSSPEYPLAVGFGNIAHSTHAGGREALLAHHGHAYGATGKVDWFRDCCLGDPDGHSAVIGEHRDRQRRSGLDEGAVSAGDDDRRLPTLDGDRNIPCRGRSPPHSHAA